MVVASLVGSRRGSWLHGNPLLSPCNKEIIFGHIPVWHKRKKKGLCPHKRERGRDGKWEKILVTTTHTCFWLLTFPHNRNENTTYKNNTKMKTTTMRRKEEKARRAMSGASRWSHKTQNRRKRNSVCNGKKKKNKKTTNLSCQQKGGLHDHDNGTFLTKHKAWSRQPN